MSHTLRITRGYLRHTSENELNRSQIRTQRNISTRDATNIIKIIYLQQQLKVTYVVIKRSFSLCALEL